MKKALVVWGGWEGHEPEACAGIVEKILKTKGMSVRVESDLQAFADPELKTLDLIVPIITQSDIDDDALSNLIDAIESGVGLAGFHGGMGDTFRHKVNYQFITYLDRSAG